MEFWFKSGVPLKITLPTIAVIKKSPAQCAGLFCLCAFRS
jgi:hypothetical protein